MPKLFGPSFSGTGQLVERDVTDADVPAYLAAGYKFGLLPILETKSAAPVALDGTNPTPVAHGLNTCLATFVQLTGSVAPGLGTSMLTAVINGPNIDVYAWKATSATNPTLIASTGTETFNWTAMGT